MEQNKNPSGDNVDLGDEKTKIIEDKSPEKIRPDKITL